MKIAIADDHALVREGLSAVLVQTQNISDVYEAGTLDELTAVLDTQGDIGLVLLDLDMPGMCDVKTLEQLQEKYPMASFAILSGNEVASVAKRFLEAGAAGYIPKSANNDVLLCAIQLIASGDIYVPPFAMKNNKAKNGSSLDLTDRQSDVLTLMVQGHSNKAIARDLDISESTVKTHSSAILKAFGVDNRMKAIHEAIRLGIAESP